MIRCAETERRAANYHGLQGLSAFAAEPERALQLAQRQAPKKTNKKKKHWAVDPEIVFERFLAFVASTDVIGDRLFKRGDATRLPRGTSCECLKLEEHRNEQEKHFSTAACTHPPALAQRSKIDLVDKTWYLVTGWHVSRPYVKFALEFEKWFQKCFHKTFSMDNY